MKKAEKILCIILTLLMLFSSVAVFTSCQPQKTDEPGTPDALQTSATPESGNSGESNTTTEASLSPLEVKDFREIELAEVRMLWPEYLVNEGHFLHNELAVENVDPSNTLDWAIYRRNMAVEDAYHVSIIVETQKYSTIPKTVRNEFAVGESSYGAIATVIGQMSPLALEGALADFNDLQYYDESQEWWNHKVMQSLSITNKRYFGSGDIIYSDDLYPYVVYANTGLAIQLQLGVNFYELVQEKEWTLEKFHELAVLAVADLDGDGEVCSSLDDQYGAIDGTSFARALYYTAGKGVISLDEEGYPTWELTPGHGDEVLSKIVKALHVDNAVVDVGTKFNAKTAVEIMNLFNSDKTLFMPGDLKAAQTFTLMDNALQDFALLPMPLWEEDSEYICVMNDAVVIGVPSRFTKKDDVSLLLSAMSRASVDTLTSAFFESILTYRYLANDESVEMLNLILDSIVPRDVADIQGWGGFMQTFSRLAVDNSTDFASYYEGHIGEARAKMDAYITQLDNINT